ncbi:MAG: four helix bundle protein [Cryomorphaceae bacterium]|jgi:four helix bundle protein|nr:four helix bundle protein [Cryomorphaceae bacterium]
MGTLNRFEDLKVWKDARILNKELFSIFLNKDTNKYGFLGNHIFKTSGSIMNNIAEGFEREGNKEFIQFLAIAKGSSGELRSQLYRALDLGLIIETDHATILDRLTHISAQINLFISYLKKSEFKGNKFKEKSIAYGESSESHFFESEN